MVEFKDYIDNKGRELNIFCGEEGWIVKFGGICHYIENQDGFDKNLEAVTKYVREFFGEVKEKLAV